VPEVRMSRCIRNLMICIILAANSLHGVHMRHDQVQELMDAMNAPKVAHVLREEHDNGDDD
jgi:hypothetical protein